MVTCQDFAGGMTLGMAQAGLSYVGKRELPGGFGKESVLENLDVLADTAGGLGGGNGSLPEGYDEGPWEEWDAPRDVDVVAGNPPCSGFSVSTTAAHRGIDARVNSCMWALVEFAGRVDPDLVCFESVQQAFSGGRELMQALRDRIEERTGHRFGLWHVKHSGLGTGGVALRRRYFFVVSRVPFGVETSPLARERTLWDAIGDLERLPARIGTWGERPYPEGEVSEWADGLRRDDGLVDGHVLQDSVYTHRLSDLMDVVEWDIGETIEEVCARAWREHGELPDSFRDDWIEKMIEKDWDSGSWHQPTRWDKDKWSRVVDGSSAIGAGHPTVGRPLSLRELYRIQGFPDTWRLDWGEPMSNGVFSYPGKGVAVPAGRWLGDWVVRSLRGEPGEDRGEEIGEREWLIDRTYDWRD